MLEIRHDDQGRLTLKGRLDAARIDQASRAFDSLTEPTVVDFGGLDYISSIGLGLLIKTQKRLMASSGGGLKFVNMSQHIHTIFRFSGFHQIFEIEVQKE